MKKLEDLDFLDTCEFKQAAQIGLSKAEYERACKLVDNKENNDKPAKLTKLEAGIIGSMWSEHCSYKSSKIHLRKLPSKAEYVLIGPGENAGVIDIGDNQALVFKVESHNHPSFIEPFEGAATGMGGILRDVFTMGARPVAAMNLLRFGEESHPKTNYLLNGVVSGISSYGNCFGVPTVMSDVDFDKSYNGNILVNAFALGLVEQDKIFLGEAKGVGNPIFYAGAKTGADGINGATMASDSFSEDSESKRPTVQVGDPFKEKILLEACLEAFRKELVVGIQDMGAAGMTSSTFEMAGRSGTGVEINLNQVPLRAPNMTPYEIMLSESQERMLLVAKQGCEEELTAVYNKWGLDCHEIGKVTGDGYVRLFWDKEEVCVLPALALSEEAPEYDREYAVPSSQTAESKAQRDLQLNGQGSGERTNIYQQYDKDIQLGTLKAFEEADAAVIRVKSQDSKPEKHVAMTIVSESHRCALDPRVGAIETFILGYLKLACVGAKTLAISDCLNYGNPEKPDQMWQLKEGIEGLAEVCEKLEVPVISGNVSLYNETDNNSINPTPALAFVGRIKKCNYKINKNFRKFENKNFVLGEKYKNDLDFKKVENLAEFLCFCVGEDIFNTAEACGQNNYLSYGQVRIAVCEDNLEKFKAGLDKYDIRSEQL